MRMLLFAVHDRKGLCYETLHAGVAIGAALRDFGDAVNNDQIKFKAHPDDYSFYQVGEWDNVSGEVFATVPPKFLGKGSDFVLEKRVPIKIEPNGIEEVKK